MRRITVLDSLVAVHVSSYDILASLSRNASCLHYILHSTSVERKQMAFMATQAKSVFLDITFLSSVVVSPHF